MCTSNKLLKSGHNLDDLKIKVDQTLIRELLATALLTNNQPISTYLQNKATLTSNSWSPDNFKEETTND
jgi:hypothetical protein